jgi:hypothetical protein
LRIRQSNEGLSGIISDQAEDLIKKLFQLAVVVSVLLFGYLMYGLFFGDLSAVSGKPDLEQHAVQLVGQFSNYLNIALVVTLLTSILLYYDESIYGFSLLAIAAFLAYGVQFCLDLITGSESSKITSGMATKALLHEFLIMAMMIGAPGLVMVLRALFVRIMEGRQGEDLTSVQYGQNAAREDDTPRALIPVLAKCWQLPFCRAGIRKKCPIFLAKTKCWKEKVGCMCEENIIMLAMGGAESQTPVNMTKEMGFVPIGDLLAKNSEDKRANIPTRQGPNGVRIPVNPHITPEQQKYRCHNCIIYNEHQRLKYSFFSVPVTLFVPVLVFWQFDSVRMMLTSLLKGIDKLVAHLQFSGDGAVSLDLSRQIAGSMPIETILIICLVLVLMTWAQRLLEYCIFTIKI